MWACMIMKPDRTKKKSTPRKPFMASAWRKPGGGSTNAAVASMAWANRTARAAIARQYCSALICLCTGSSGCAGSGIGPLRRFIARAIHDEHRQLLDPLDRMHNQRGIASPDQGLAFRQPDHREASGFPDIVRDHSLATELLAQRFQPRRDVGGVA